MEFNYCDGRNGRTALPLSRPLSAATYVSRYPLQGCEFVPGGLSGNVSVPRVFPLAVPINAEEALQRELEEGHIRQELERQEIRREIIANEMAMARRRELEEEVRREIALARASKIPMQGTEGISFNNNISKACGYHISLPSRHFPVHNRQASAQTSKDKVIHLAKPDADHWGGKRKAATPAGDDRESLQKKVKKEWSCDLCQITATSERGLNDHIQGKKHKAKASARTQKIGLDSRPEGQTLHPCLTPAHTRRQT